MRRFSRRDFLRIAGLTTTTVVTSYGLSACSSDNEDSTDTSEDSTDTGGADTTYSGAASFDHGVASGDPRADSVIIWTRVSTEQTDATLPVQVQWQVASDAEFSDISHDESVLVTAETDYTLKVDVQNLQSGTNYYYRFVSNGTISASGQTSTLPGEGIDQIRFAVVSCSNYPTGYFNVYREIVNQAPDVVLHLGDYIYEYGEGGYGTDNAEALGRTLPADNNSEILTLTDYRNRYALYRSDVDLQDMHAVAPMIAVWDDHEVTNDTWLEGAENHNENPAVDEGDFFERRRQAFQAYFEWMPIRAASVGDNETIYRQFEFGELVNLIMLDTRNAGRDEQLTLEQFIDPTSGSFNATEFTAAVGDSNRSLLGAEQRSWLQNAVASSSAIWQVTGQQVLMGRMNLPIEILLDPQNPAVFAELVAIKSRQLLGNTLTAEEQQRLAIAVPYNLDAWDGYAAEREFLLGLMAEGNKNFISLAGDTHNAWSNTLRLLSGDVVGQELATSSVTSPGLEDLLGVDSVETAVATEGALTTLIDDLTYSNLLQRGFLMVTINRTSTTAEWLYVDTIESRQYTVDTARTFSQVIPVA